MIKNPATRMRMSALVVLICFILGLAPGGTTGTPVELPAVSAVDSIGLTVSDLDRSVSFYRDVLSFEKISECEASGDELERLTGVFGSRVRIARMRLGSETIELTEYLAPRGRPVPADSRSNDKWFQHIAIITADMEKSYTWLRRYRVEHASPGPQRLPDWNPNAGGIEAFYFRDPDGHPLEVLRFPAGKGDPKWRRLAEEDPARLFLGIDHTAIVVADTDESLRFYRDTLGMRIAGESENYGIEQERLNNVFGARLRITALRASAGPGIEFLEYRAPRDGRPTPDDKRSNDLIDWQTSLRTGNIERTADEIRGRNYRIISSGIRRIPGADKMQARGLLVRDPDSHSIRLIGN